MAFSILETVHVLLLMAIRWIKKAWEEVKLQRSTKCVSHLVGAFPHEQSTKPFFVIDDNGFDDGDDTNKLGFNRLWMDLAPTCP